MDRNCDNCARCGRDGCKSWDCDYIPRDEAIEAWKEKCGKAEIKFVYCGNKLPESDGDALDELSTLAAKAIDEFYDQTDCAWK